MKRTPVLIDVNGVPLRESLSYNGGGAGFGGQMAEWLPPAQSADAALLPALRLGNARADDLVRNNGIAANAVALHKDHIVGHMFLISYRPNWRWLGMRETAAKSFVDEVEAAWSEYAEGMSGEIDVEEKRTFTEFIREGVGVHAFNGEIFVQPVWDTESTQLFRTRFKAVSPKRVDTPGHGMGNRFLRAGVEVDRYGRAVAYHIRERENAAHDVREETSGALTRIRVLTCLHLCSIDGETGESVEIADVGRVILIMSSDAKT
ncbi:phage portal protein, partial [Escherichia coli]